MNNNEISKLIAQAKNICVIKADALGDFLLATPALKALRAAAPQAKITLLVSPYVYQLAQGLSCVDLVLGVKLLQVQEKTPELLQATAAAISQTTGPFDVAIVMRWDADWYGATPLAHALKAQYRIGYSVECLASKKQLTPSYDALLTHALDDKHIEHEVIKNVRLVGSVEQVPNFQGIHWSDEPVPIDIAERHFYGIAISASNPFKKLDVSHWVRLIHAMQAKWGLRFIIFGGPEEVDIKQGALITQQTGAVNLCAQLNPRQTLVALKNCKGMIAVDSFIKHAAAFIGVPVVELSAASKKGNPYGQFGGIRFGAYGVKTAILKPDLPLPACGVDVCQASSSHCINQIKTDEVLQAVQDIFELERA